MRASRTSGLELRLSRRLRAPISFFTAATFTLSLAWVVPRPAHADESAPSVAPNVELPSVAEVPSEDFSKTVPKPPAETAAPDSIPVGTKTAPHIDLPSEHSGTGAPDSPKSLPTDEAKTGVSSQAISVPQGAGKIQGMGESFSAQLSTGIATFSVPFALPSARGGAQPSLSLSYSSSGGHGVAGVGWEIGAPFIARQTDRGIPNYLDGTDWTPQQDRFVFNGGQELVPICKVAGGACAGAISGEVMPTWADGWQYFRPRIEGSFLRFFWSLDHKTWRVQAKSGETMELGVPLDGSGYVGGLETDPAHGERIFRWSLTRQYDAQRAADKPVNVVAYRYLVVDGTGYLTDVYDTPPASDPAGAAVGAYAHHARLRYENRPDPTFSYRRGWRVGQTMRLTGVDVTSKTFSGEGARELVRRYHLAYASTYHVSLLTRVQLEGRCTPTNPVEDATGALASVTSCPTLPAMRLDYQHVDAYTTTGAAGVADLEGYEGFDERVLKMAGSPDHSLDEEMTDLFDINADSLPDVLVTAGAIYGGKHGVFFNGLGGVSNGFGAVRGVAVTGEAGLAGADATTITLKNLNVAAADVDANGIVDFVHMPKVKTYGIYTPRPTAGAKDAYDWEWFGRAVTTASSLSPKIDFGKDATDIRMMDVNGDGLVDAVYAAGTELQTFFSLGRFPGGFGQFGSAKWTSASTAAISNDPIRTCVPLAGTPVRWSDAEVKVADMNGDGLPDIVKLQKGKIEYWPGRGDGTWGTGDPTACKAGSFSTGTSIVMTTSPYFTDPSVGALRVDDVNGDGLDDLVQIRFDAVDIWLNVDGVAWTDRHIIAGTPASPSYLTRTRLVDANGSGTRDVLWGDAFNYRFIDLLGGKRPWVLNKVENGLGKTTELEYASSSQLMLADEKAGKGWTKKSPLVQHVVVKETIRDNVSGAMRPSGVYVTQYAYKDPVYDGLQREFRGFSSTRVTSVGDANSPTSFSDSTFLLGECKVSPDNSCEPRDAWKDSPREALKGLPVLTEPSDEAKTYTQTAHHTYTLRELYRGRDGRAVKHAFESQSDTFLYDTAPFNSSESDRTLTDLVEEPLSGASSTDTRSVRVRSFAGRVRLASSSVVDRFGNGLSSTASGCVEGCSPLDEAITSVTTPALVTGDTSGWLWRTVRSYVSGSTTTAPRHDTRVVYNAFGSPTKTTAILSGSLPLDRFHAVVGSSVAPAPPAASVDTEITLDQTQYDTLGNVIFASGANGRCRVVEHDALFADLATSESVYVGPPVSRTFGGTSFTCGNLALTASAAYDRGFELATVIHDLHGELSQVQYDGFGRVTALYKPDPTTIGALSALPSIKVEYFLSEPVSRMHTSVQDGATPSDPAYREGWAYVDGLGRTIATLDEADLSAGDGGSWVVNGFTDYDAKGTPQRAFLAWFYGGTPESFSVSLVPGTRYGRKRYDAFGRGLQSYGLDGQTTMFSAYHALSTDAWDAADLTPGPHYGTPASERKDGHGRTVAVTERVHAGAAIEEREIRNEYLPTGETSRITRVRVGMSDPPVTRWMQYDSLGRMVLNVEPNTSKAFDPDPSTFAGKAWRYAYDDAGDLVGTSDARGCGTNYLYDAAGRLRGEDYSPCLAHHPAYSTPVFTPGAETGLEVLNRYDYAPSDKSDIPDCSIDVSLYAGRLAEVWDRGARTVSVYDGRGRVTCAARQMGKPGVPSDTLATRYAPRWYAQTAKFDGADRPVEESTGAKVPELMGGDGKSVVTTSYTARGSVRAVAGSYGTLVAAVAHDADGLAESIEYGDVAHTTTAFEYDDKRRLRSVQTYRGPPSIWTSGGYSPAPTYGSGVPSTFQLVLEDLEYKYDSVDNPIEIRDWRDPKEWPAGAKPVTRKIDYDDLYRVSSVAYQYHAGDDTWVSPFAAENAGTATDPRLAKPSPHVAFDKRVLSQTFHYDWLGNTTQTGDNANGFYDRSLGIVSNGAAAAGPYQLKSASLATGPRAGALTAKYDDSGYLTSLAVRRDGPCLPASALCGQRFVYDWDEVGRLQRARRWDLTAVGTASDAEPVSAPDVGLGYQYDSSNQRTRKTADIPSGDAHHSLSVFVSLDIRHSTWSGSDFSTGAYTEVPYLSAGALRLARVAYEDDDVPSFEAASRPRLHLFLELPDHLGSTNGVLDLQTSELVEKTEYLPTGAAESDFRPARWKSFREDRRFSGKEEDVEVGLTYFGHRYLAASLGRWASADPMALHDVQADLNLYAYVGGWLFRATDPTGLEAIAGGAEKLPVVTTQGELGGMKVLSGTSGEQEWQDKFDLGMTCMGGGGGEKGCALGVLTVNATHGYGPDKDDGVALGRIGAEGALNVGAKSAASHLGPESHSEGAPHSGSEVPHDATKKSLASPEAPGVCKSGNCASGGTVSPHPTDYAYQNGKTYTNSGGRRAYGPKTPTSADRAAIGAGKGEVADHNPGLMRRFWHGDRARGELPGRLQGPQDREASAKDRSRMEVQQQHGPGGSNSQGGHDSAYSKQMNKVVKSLPTSLSNGAGCGSGGGTCSVGAPQQSR